MAIAEGESLTLTLVKPAGGELVASETGQGPLTIAAPDGTHLLKVELETDDTSSGLGVAYSLDLE